MSNLLKVAMIDAILSLHRRGWSAQIAIELDINRETVVCYLKQARDVPKPLWIGVREAGPPIPVQEARWRHRRALTMGNASRYGGQGAQDIGRGPRRDCAS